MRAIQQQTRNTVKVMMLLACVAAMTGVPKAQAVVNGRIVYSSDVEGNKEIYTMNSNGTDIRRLTNNPAGDEGAIWSPDATQIVFKSNRNKSTGIKNDYDLFIMNVDGSNVRSITNFHPSHERGASFLSDGNRVAFSSDKDGDFDIYSIKLDGTDLRQEINVTGSQTTTHWHPSGNRIAFTNKNNQNIFGLSQVTLSTGVITNLTNTSTFHSQIPAWSPDGTQMAYRRDRVDSETDDTEIALMDADGSNQRNLTNNTADDLGPAWSPDGTKIAFSSERDGNSEIYIMNADGSNQTRITNTSASEDDIDWGTNQGGGGEPDPTATPQPTNTPFPTPTQTAGPTNTQAPGNPADVDNNGSVNLVDLQALAANFNRTQFSIRDPQPDGKITIFDFSIVVRALYAQNPSATPTTGPSPTSGPTPTIGATPTPTPPQPTPIAIPGEMRILEWNKLAEINHSGFLVAKPAPDFAQGNWVTPDNYVDGKLYFRARVNGIPVNQPNMKLGFCFWQGTGPNAEGWGEECLASQLVPAVSGSDVQWVRNMADRNVIGGAGNDIDWTIPRWQYGIVVRNGANKPVSKKAGMNWNGEDPLAWYPLDIRFTVVLVKKNQAFSGWDNYDW